MKRLSKQQILGGLSRKEPRARSWVYRNYYEEVQGWVEGITGPGSETADLTHDVFTGLFEYEGQFDKINQIRYFLFQKAKNISLNYMKHKQFVADRSEGLALHLQSLPCEEEFEERWRLTRSVEIARELLEQFSEKSREVYLLYLEKHLNNKQIAERLQITEYAVANHKYKALQFIRTHAREISQYLLFIINVFLCVYQQK